MSAVAANTSLTTAYRHAGRHNQARFFFGVGVGNLLLSPLYFAFDVRWLNNPNLDPRHAERLLISHTTIVVLAAIYVAVSLFNRAYPGRIPDGTVRVLLGLSAVLIVAVPAMLAILNQLPGSNGSIVAYVLAIIGLVAFAYEPVGFIIAVVLGSAAAVMAGVAVFQDDPATTLPNLLNVTTTAVLATVVYPLYDRFRLREFSAQQEVKRLSDLRQTTLRALAHDVRLPIHTIRRSSAALDDPSLNDAAARAALGAELGAAADQAERIVDNLTSLGQTPRHEHTASELAFTALSDVVEAATESVRNEAAVKHTAIEAQDSFDVLVKGQGPILIAIVQNLLANAVKFSHAGGKVVLTCDVTRNEVALRVRDFGLGMNDATVARLNRGEDVPSQPGSEGERGAGVGLSVARAFVDAMGAHLAFASTEGAGTEATLRMTRHRREP